MARLVLIYSDYTVPWICYERSFNELYLSILNQLDFNQKLQLFVQSLQPFFMILPEELNVFSQHIGSKNEYLNSAEQIPGDSNVNLVYVLIASWDITFWCSINLLWKE